MLHNEIDNFIYNKQKKPIFETNIDIHADNPDKNKYSYFVDKLTTRYLKYYYNDSKNNTKYILNLYHN